MLGEISLSVIIEDMIPISLSMEGFLSYKERVEIDFTSFALACITGENGAREINTKSFDPILREKPNK